MKRLYAEMQKFDKQIKCAEGEREEEREEEKEEERGSDMMRK
jgi:hypothetical protein